MRKISYREAMDELERHELVIDELTTRAAESGVDVLVCIFHMDVPPGEKLAKVLAGADVEAIAAEKKDATLVLAIPACNAPRFLELAGAPPGLVESIVYDADGWFPVVVVTKNGSAVMHMRKNREQRNEVEHRN